MIFYYAECRYAECHQAECCYAECRYAWSSISMLKVAFYAQCSIFVVMLGFGVPRVAAQIV